MRAWIEDVVVDSEVTAARGSGSCSSGLLWSAPRRSGARTVDLTSRPSRADANRLYMSLGFEPRETNVYRYNARQTD